MKETARRLIMAMCSIGIVSAIVGLLTEVLIDTLLGIKIVGSSVIWIFVWIIIGMAIA